MDMDTGKRYLQFFLLTLEFLLMGISLWPACWIVLRFSSEASTPIHWVLLILLAILVFNYVYLIALLILRIITPIPKEGLYENSPGGKPHRETVVFMFNVLLVLLRYRPPWAAFISALLVNLFPLKYFFRRFFGPDTSSTTIGDNYVCLDPYLVKAGKNVQFGAFSIIAGHTTFSQTSLYIKRVEIGDNVIIGGHAKIGPGTKIGHNSIVGVDSVVLPDSVIGDNEYWSGNPARRRKKLSAENSDQS